jgi:hypothetical protein
MYSVAARMLFTDDDERRARRLLLACNTSSIKIFSTHLRCSENFCDSEALDRSEKSSGGRWKKRHDKRSDRVNAIEDTLSDQAHIRPYKLRVSLASRARPRLLGELDLLTDWIPTGSSIQHWFEISHPPVLTCQVPTEETAVCTEFLDSIFKVELKTGKVGVLFYPAGVRRAWDTHARYAFYARGGFRLFVTRLN